MFVLPHLLPAGNHEAANDFLQYIGRFNDMPLQPTPAPAPPTPAPAPITSDAGALSTEEQVAAALAAVAGGGSAPFSLDVKLGLGDTPVDSMWHSFNAGPVHVVMFSSEAYFWLSAHGLPMVAQQYAWLEADLAAVDRSVTPWVIVSIKF